jgi:hypothetical protein
LAGAAEKFEHFRKIKKSFACGAKAQPFCIQKQQRPGYESRPLQQ